MFLGDFFSMETAYPTLIEQVRKHGFTALPRGTVCQEIRPASFSLRSPEFALYTGASRRMSFRLAAIEALMYISGWDCVEAAELITMIAPNTAQFMNRKTSKFDGAYGPRLRYGLAQCVELLKADPWSRRACASVWNSGAQSETNDLPCTLTMQFMLAANMWVNGEPQIALDMHVSMRSNDLNWGLPNDIAAFSIIHMIMARLTNLPLGHYHHTVGSLHYYMQGENGESEPDLPDAEEGWACDIDGPTRLPEIGPLDLADMRGVIPVTTFQHNMTMVLRHIHAERKSGKKWKDIRSPQEEDDQWLRQMMDMVRFSWQKRERV